MDAFENLNILKHCRFPNPPHWPIADSVDQDQTVHNIGFLRRAIFLNSKFWNVLLQAGNHQFNSQSPTEKILDFF